MRKKNSREFPCSCGCGNLVYGMENGKPKFYSSPCRTQYYQDLMVTGCLPAEGWTRCKCCGEYFPYFKKLPKTREIFTCHPWLDPNCRAEYKKNQAPSQTERKTDPKTFRQTYCIQKGGYSAGITYRNV